MIHQFKKINTVVESFRKHTDKIIVTLVLQITTRDWREPLWSEWKKCPDRSFASAFRLRIQPQNDTNIITLNVGYNKTENTALNSIELRCTNTKGIETA